MPSHSSGADFFFTRDDIARLATWLQSTDGTIAGRRLLDRGRLDAALARDPSAPGLHTGTPGLRYRGGFWQLDVAPYVGCREATWVPFMAGYGGIVIVLFPNGVIYYRFGDGGTSKWRHVIKAVHELRPLCR